MSEPRKIVLIIGNGFDLDLRLKTSDKDFEEPAFVPYSPKSKAKVWHTAASHLPATLKWISELQNSILSSSPDWKTSTG